MELVYLWVEDYKNIKKQGFNFSPRFRCEYNDETKELTIDENDDYIPDFFGKNINVTAIVGKNGSGKSSVLEKIDSFEICHNGIDNSKDLLIFYIDDVLFVSKILDVLNLTNIKHTYENPESSYMIYTLNLKKEWVANKLEVTPSFIIQSILQNRKLKNIQISGFFGKINKIELNESDDYRKFLINRIENRTKEIFDTDINKEKMNALLNQNKYMFDREEVKTLIELLMYVEILENKNILLLIEFLNEIKQVEYFNYRLLLNKFHYKTLKQYRDIDEYNTFISKKVFNYLELTNQEIKFILDYIYFFKINFYNDSGISFNDLSSGEKELFGQFFLLHKNMSTSNNIGLSVRLLDEPENSLHPKWQTSYIKEVIHSFSIYKSHSLHFILT